MNIEYLNCIICLCLVFFLFFIIIRVICYISVKRIVQNNIVYENFIVIKNKNKKKTP